MTPDGFRMPRGDLPGFTMVVEEDYLASFPRGDGTGPGIEDLYPGHKAYDGFPDTSRNGWYDKSNRTVYVADSCLILHCHWDTARNRPSVACLVPGGYEHAQQYGKWTWRMWAPGGPGVAQYKIVPLFWPASNVFGDGEWNFPEQRIGSDAALQINLHTATVADAARGNGTIVPNLNVTEPHVYDVEWTPARATFSVDGTVRRTLESSSIAWPKGPMRWVIQAEVDDVTIGSPPPDPASVGVVYVDWVKQYAYTGDPGTG